jgi:WD40 repeat protein
MPDGSGAPLSKKSTNMAADPQKLKMVKDLGRPEICFSVARIPNTSRLFYGASDAKVYHVDFAAEKLEPQAMEGHSSYVSGVALAGPNLISGSYDCSLIWWNAETRQVIKKVENAHSKWIRNLVATPDGKYVISVADDMLAKVWNAATGDLVHTLVDHQALTPHHYPSMLFACNTSADSTLLATGDKVGHVVIWDIATGKKLGSIEAVGLYTWDPSQRRHSIGGVRSVAFSPDNKLVAAGGVGKIGNIDHLDGPSRLEVFDWKENKKVYETEDSKFKGLIERIAFEPQGQWLVAAGGDHAGFINFYTPADGKIIKQEKFPAHVHSFVMNEANDTLFLAAHGKVSRWEFKAEGTA